MSFKENAKKGIKWSFLNTVIISVVALLKISILTRFLEKADFGLVALVTFFLGFTALFNDMGLTSAILHKLNISKKEYASLYWLNVFLSIFLYLTVLLISPFVAQFYNEPLLKVLIPIMGISILLSGMGRQFRTIFQKELEFKTIAIVEIAAAIISLFIAIYLAVNDFGVYSLIYSALFQHLVSNGCFLIYGLKREGMLFYFNFNKTKSFLKIGSYQVGSQVINYFNKDLDILIVGKFFSPEVLGGYSLAKQLVSRPAQVLNQIISNVGSPILAKDQLNVQILKKNFLKLFNGFFYVNSLAYLGLCIFAPLAVNLLYGAEYEKIVILVRVLSFYMLIRSIGSPIGSLIIAKGKTDLEFKWNVILLCVLPIFVFIGSFYSIEWVAYSMTLGLFLVSFPGWWFLIKGIIVEISFKEFLMAFRFRKFWK